jgi:hypothetical protein
MARSWIFDDNYHFDNEFSCIRICNTLGKNIKALRLNVLFAEQKGWTLDDLMKFSFTGKDPKVKENGQDR